MELLFASSGENALGERTYELVRVFFAEDGILYVLAAALIVEPQFPSVYE
jgi:hypothetical protein